MSRARLGLATFLVAVVLGTTFALWREAQRSGSPAAPAAPGAAAPAPEAPAADAPTPAVRHPIDAPPLDAETAADPQSAIQAALGQLLGDDVVRSSLVVDGFARRFVATVDGLGRAHAPPALWPVPPASGRFTVVESGGEATIAPSNEARHRAFVALVEKVDVARAVALYRRFYPWFQRTYASLGFPDRAFNDRVVDVVDLLLATPEPAEPPEVHLPVIEGPYRASHPWVRYRFSNPDLEALASGQKILLRIGPEHRRRLKAKLAEVRAALVADAASAGAAR